MTYLTRIASYGQTNPMPIPETAELTPEQRSEYTFLLTQDSGDNYLVPEMDARQISPLIEHLDVGSAYYFLGT